jgi:hypothetical protein
VAYVPVWNLGAGCVYRDKKVVGDNVRFRAAF